MSKKSGFADTIAQEAEKNLQPVPETRQVKTDEHDTHIGGYFSEDVYIQMKIIGAEKNMKMREMLAEAFNMFFRVHKKPPIAS